MEPEPVEDLTQVALVQLQLFQQFLQAEVVVILHLPQLQQEDLVVVVELIIVVLLPVRLETLLP